MKNLLFLFGALVGVEVCAQQTPGDILIKASKALEPKKSVSYHVKAGQKFFDHEDTVKLEGNMLLMRDEKDTIFGSRFFMEMSPLITNVYDGRHVYQVRTKQDTAMRYFMDKKQDWVINGNMSVHMLWKDFMKPGNIASRVSAENKLTLHKDTVVDKQPCYKITIRYPDEEEFTDQMRIMLIRKKDFIPVFSAFQIKYQGNYQYDFISLLNIVFDNVKPDAFTLKKFKNFTVVDYKEMTEEERKAYYALLETNAVAPLLKGHVYGSKEKISEIDYAGKVTLLDFWYMACVWCIKSVPYIEKLREKFGDKLQVIGVNSFDNNKKSIERIPQFLEHNPMKYPIVLVEKDFIDACKVKMWPSFYLIGPDGKIKFSRAGGIVDDATVDEWIGEIEKLIGK